MIDDIPMTTDKVSELLDARGHEVAWPVTGMLWIDGVEIDVSEIMELACDVWEACDHIENKISNPVDNL